MLRTVWQTLRTRTIPVVPQTPLITTRNFHKDFNAAKEDQSFKLADGRNVGFAEYGDPKGIPAFLFHGSPGSRYDGLGFLDIGKKLNMRIICPDRPGHGLSTFQPNRKLIDYPNDISQIAKHLGVPKYHVFGISGGGPYVVSCAHGSPRDELLTATVIAGMAPPEAITMESAGWYTVTALAVARWIPGVMESVGNWSIGTPAKLEYQLKHLHRLFQPEDKEYLTDPEKRHLLVGAFKEALKQGMAGPVRDSQIYGEPWGFELKDVDRKVNLFYGHRDNRTPVAFGRYFKEHLPNAELVEYKDASHVTIEKYDEEMLRKILGMDKSQTGTAENALESTTSKL